LQLAVFFLFAKLPRQGDSEVTVAIFESSCHLSNHSNKEASH